MGSITYIISIIVLLLGLTVVIAPKQCTKKEKQSDAAAIKRNRGLGLLVAVIGAMMLVVNILYIKL